MCVMQEAKRYNGVSVDPSFTHTGLDVFGLFTVATRKTRDHSTENKQWAVIFSCLSTRAVHLEVMESLISINLHLCFVTLLGCHRTSEALSFRQRDEFCWSS